MAQVAHTLRGVGGGFPLLDDAWRKSSLSEFSTCVEVRLVGDRVPLRNSRDPDGPVVVFTAPEWDAFVAAVKLGEFDLPTT
jgi:hypothetical protein